MGYNARWYTDEGHLRDLGREHLNRLLDKYKTDLAKAGIKISQPAKDDDYYKELAAVFMRPEGIPAPLHDALYFIKGLDSTSGLDRIAECVSDKVLKIDLGAETSIADKALQAWLQNERLVRQLHVEVGLDASKSFVHFRARGAKAPVMRDFAKVRDDFQTSLGVSFEDKGRGYWCEVSCHPRGKDFVFVVRHVEPFRRETQRLKNATQPLFYWPSSQDLVVYNDEDRILRMNVMSRWQKEGYSRNFGEYLFGDPQLFTEEPVYTLQPLRERGRGALAGDVYGMSSIRLTELQCCLDEDTNDILIRRGDDVLRAYEKDGGFPAEPFISAKFCVNFKETGHERVVTVTPPNRAKYTQDRDGLCVTSWLRETFIAKRQDSKSDDD
jgi:hypothetical protein